MKYYESHYEEYIESKKKYELHPELSEFMENLPEKAINMGNLIVYGPSGVGKYSQVLQILKKYSSTQLKYDKKLTAQTEKQNYTYHISDIHYEIDMSLLGCNFKILWNEIFQVWNLYFLKLEHLKRLWIIICFIYF
jgi:Cdc6-like AAA superfamily ATPase